MTRFDKKFRKRFWAQVEKGSGSACWVWRGYLRKDGYGQLQCRAASGMPLYVHRVAWELRNGPPPAGAHVLHRCDTPACVRPGHLFLGTHLDNVQDRVVKGRTASGDNNGARTCPERNPFVKNGGSGLCGAEHPQARLTEEQVVQLRARFAAGERRADIAAAFGISVTHVYRIGGGKNWGGGY